MPKKVPLLNFTEIFCHPRYFICRRLYLQYFTYFSDWRSVRLRLQFMRPLLRYRDASGCLLLGRDSMLEILHIGTQLNKKGKPVWGLRRSNSTLLQWMCCRKITKKFLERNYCKRMMLHIMTSSCFVGGSLQQLVSICCRDERRERRWYMFCEITSAVLRRSHGRAELT